MRHRPRGRGHRGRNRRRGEETSPIHAAHQVNPVSKGYAIVVGSPPTGMSTGSFPCGEISPRITFASDSIDIARHEYVATQVGAEMKPASYGICVATATTG